MATDYDYRNEARTIRPHNEYKDQGRSLPKFGEWDVNNPASAEGFTVIFSKARDEKKSTNGGANGQNSQRNDNPPQQRGDHLDNSLPKKWRCCF